MSCSYLIPKIFMELISGGRVKISGVRGITSGVRGNKWGNGVHI